MPLSMGKKNAYGSKNTKVKIKTYNPYGPKTGRKKAKKR